MPTYEYECPLCGRFEVEQRISEPALKARPNCDRKGCPKCAERIIFAAPFQLKGGGWYKDGYGSSTAKKPDAAAGASGAKADAPASDSKAGDAKAASASEGASGAKSSGDTGATNAKKGAKGGGDKGGGGGCGSGCGCH